MTPAGPVRKKLIEVALPLEAINKASAREKSIRHGHPSTLHLWWARRPLAAARAVIFAQMVDDPSAYVDVLRGDSKLRRKGETLLRARRKVWEEARALADKAKGSGVTVPEPGPEPTLDEILADQERQRLFRIIEDLVLWENTTNEAVLQTARDEIWNSWRRACAENADQPRAKELFNRNRLPAFHDPFAGGGALPLEAQRLGLEAYASDLNPVAVLINKAMIEIPPKFSGKPPVSYLCHSGRSEAETRNPGEKLDSRFRGNDELFVREWKGAQGLAEDVRYYGKWMRDEAEKRIGHLYPKIEITKEMANERPDLKALVGKELTVIAWIWARTVKSPNPAFAKVDVPLASTFMLSTKEGKEAYVDPVIEGHGYRFTVKVGKPKDAEAAKKGTKLERANFVCLMSAAPIAANYIMAEGKAGRMGAKMMAIVVEGDGGRVYLPATPEMEAVAKQATPIWKPEVEFLQQALGFRIGNYGLTMWSDLFTSRQLVALTTFSDLVREACERVKRDALAARMAGDDKTLAAGGTGATAYTDAIGVYLGLCVSRLANRSSSQCFWDNQGENVQQVFARQALSMSWDYVEGSPFSESSGNFLGQAGYLIKAVLGLPQQGYGQATTQDAAVQKLSDSKIVSTDPPYYDNIGTPTSRTSSTSGCAAR